MDRNTYDRAVKATIEMLEKHGFALTDEEKQRIEVADFGLNHLQDTGLQILTYVNTERCCAKELVLFAGQTCPELIHPPIAGLDRTRGR